MNPESSPAPRESTEQNPDQKIYFPSFEEHMKQMQNPVENNSNVSSRPDYEYIFRTTPSEHRPEGVRDAQDLKEYTEEKEAKQAESIEKQKSAILENYNVSDSKVEALTNSKEFAAFCHSGITIDELIKKNIVIARKEDYYSSQPGEKIYDYQKESSFDDMCAMVKDLGQFYIMKENCDKVGIESQFPAIKNYIDKLDDPSSITKKDTINLVTSVFPNGGIARRLLFGNPNTIISNNVMSRTSLTLEHINDAEWGDDFSEDDIAEVLYLTDNIIEEGKFFPEGMSDYAYESDCIKRALRPRLRETVRGFTCAIAKCMCDDALCGGYDGGYTDYESLKELILKSSSEDSICIHHEILVEDASISEEELLDSVYGFNNEEHTKDKKLTEIYPEHYIARHANRLIKSGFSKDSIIDAIHNNDIYLTEEEVRDMREAGIEDVDIIYATGGLNILAYKYNRNKDEIDNDKIEIHGVVYSAKDVLGAALKEIIYQKRQQEKQY